MALSRARIGLTLHRFIGSHHARQARNLEAERQAANVRLRAERRAGELLKELARADKDENLKKGSEAPTSTPLTSGQSPYAAALSDSGMSRQTAHQYQALADLSPVIREASAELIDRNLIRAYLGDCAGQADRFVSGAVRKRN